MNKFMFEILIHRLQNLGFYFLLKKMNAINVQSPSYTAVFAVASQIFVPHALILHTGYYGLNCTTHFR